MAGEIQLNSTTMATESSGSITLSNVNSATNRTNLGLGSIATQNANAVALTGGSLTGTEIDLKSSGTTIYASNGTTSILSELSNVVTANNITLDSAVTLASSLYNIGTSTDGGYIILPSGLEIKWGVTTSLSTNTGLSFTHTYTTAQGGAFSTATRFAIAYIADRSVSSYPVGGSLGTLSYDDSASAVTFYISQSTTDNLASTRVAFIAIGN